MYKVTVQQRVYEHNEYMYKVNVSNKNLLKEHIKIRHFLHVEFTLSVEMAQEKSIICTTLLLVIKYLSGTGIQVYMYTELSRFSLVCPQN